MKGIILIHEAGLTPIATKRPQRYTYTEHSVNFSDLQLIAIGTLSDEDSSTDLKYVVK